MKSYNHKAIEKKWQAEWKKKKVYETKDTSRKPKKYILDMFPYPSGEGLHVGHPKGYIATDIYSRMKRMQGYNVLHPMGFDAFGLPAENYAIKHKVHPEKSTAKNVKHYKEQLEAIGLDYDWSREINTTDPKYYKWTQWIFLKLFEKGLAYESWEPINWCPSCQTGLANEDLEDGKCERCGSVVEKKPMRQWVLRITDYAERLLADLDALDWPESIKESQRNWIGKSEGMLFTAPVKDTDLTIQTFSAHFEAFAADTFVVIAPEHPFLKTLVAGTPNEKEVLAFADALVKKRAAQGFAEEKESEGIFTGRYIVDPVGNGNLPIWVASYALADYGTGIVKCSAHDERDFAFAKKYNIPLKAVLFPMDEVLGRKVRHHEFCFTDMKKGILSEPKEFVGKIPGENRKEIIEYLEKNKLAVRKTTYKLRDWVFSRQRYWGEPMPLVHTADGKVIPLSEKELPLTLPKVKSYAPTGTGESPLADIKKWVDVKVNPKDTHYHFIFDFDGVLGDTWKQSVEAHYQMSGQTKDKKVIEKEMVAHFSKPKHSRKNALSEEELIEIAKWTDTFGKILVGKFQLFQSFVKEIGKYKNAKLAIVSSGSNQYILPAIEGCGLHFTHILAYENHHSKEEKIETVCKDWGVNIKDVYYFTDTQSDVRELENTLDAKKIIGCAWGFHGHDLLLEVLPQRQVLRNAKDVHTFFESHAFFHRETNTMPQWAGSSWYYLRYMDPKNSKALVDPKKEKYWGQVDMYVGGTEHATRHLIYARFWHKFLYDIGVVSTTEPFMKLKNQGLIMGEDGRKMSKRWGNVVNPDDVIATYGADTLRLYEMFMGPFEASASWSTNSMIGSRRFIERLWRLAERVDKKAEVKKPVAQIIHKTLQKVTDDIDEFRFNTAISSLMICLNTIENEEKIPAELFHVFLKTLAPFIPHVAESLWGETGGKGLVVTAEWPKVDQKMLVEDSVRIGVQVNGKVRADIEVGKDEAEESVKSRALALPEIQKWLEGKPPKKIIYVKGKILNVVV